MISPLVRKLEAFFPLSVEDKDFLTRILSPAVEVGQREDLIREGDSPDYVFLIVDGFACRYKFTSDGRRHIMAYLIPGDFCDLHVFLLKEMDHSIATLSACKVIKIPRPTILALLDRPGIAKALLRAAMVDEATLREWLVNLGARPAEERVAHLLCELMTRLELVGMVYNDGYELPLTQSELADTTGLSNVHINRVLQSLRAEKLITFKSKRLAVLDVARLKAFAGFNPNYLHMDEEAPAPYLVRLQG